MISDQSIPRRVAQLENDRDALYELIDDFRSETTARFERVESRLDGLDTKLDGIDTRLDGIDTKLDGIDAGLVEILRRLPEPI